MKNHDELQKRAVEGKPVECVHYGGFRDVRAYFRYSLRGLDLLESQAAIRWTICANVLAK